MAVTILSKKYWLNITQRNDYQCEDIWQQTKSTSNIIKNYLRVLEVISSLNYELEYKSRVDRKQKMSD